MDTSIYLLNLPTLDATYQNVVDFESVGEQNIWFESKVLKIVKGNIKTDTEQEMMVLNCPLHEIKAMDYLYIIDKTGKRLYYFILKKEIKTPQTCIVHLECDVWNTYMFDYILMDSYVERCHVPRWNTEIGPNWPTLETIDEGIPLGDYMVHSVLEGYKSKETYVIASSVPLGYLQDGGYVPPGSGGSEENVCWLEGKPSRDGYRFMKGYEGFGKYLYYDSGGVATIGYGITQSQPDIFNKLVAAQPVSEEMAAKEAYEIKVKNYGKPIVDRLKELGCNRQSQFDALVDLAYNAGPGRVLGDNILTEAIKRNPNDEGYIRPIWENFIVSDALGNVLEGLKARRRAECDIYFDAKYEFRPIITINADGSYGPAVSENDGNGWLPEDCGNPTGFMFDTEYGPFRCPTTGTVSALFPSYPEGGSHNGVDIANVEGTPILAMRDGTVIISGTVSGYGNAIYIDHGNGITTRYGHILDGGLLVKAGDKVKQGQKIALMGNTGNSTGSHLHFEVRKNDVPTHPARNLTLYQEIE